MTDPTKFHLPPVSHSAESNVEGGQGSEQTSESIDPSSKRNSKKRKKEDLKNGPKLSITPPHLGLLATGSPLISPDTRKRRVSEDRDGPLSRTDATTTTEMRTMSCNSWSDEDNENGIEMKDNFDGDDANRRVIDPLLQVNYFAQEGKCDADYGCCDPNDNCNGTAGYSVEEYIRSQTMQNYEQNIQDFVQQQMRIERNFEEDAEFRASIASTFIPRFMNPLPLDEVTEENDETAPSLPVPEPGEENAGPRNHYMENITYKFKPFKVVQSAADCLEENLIYETASPRFAVPPHFAREERDVPIYGGKLDWVRVHDPQNNNAVQWERLLLALDDERSPDSRHPSLECAEDTMDRPLRYYDGDFGWKMSVPILTVSHKVHGVDVYHQKTQIRPFTIYTLRRKISLLEDGESLSMHTPVFAPADSPSNRSSSSVPPPLIQWKQCVNYSDYLFGFSFSEKSPQFEIELKKDRVYFEESYFNTTTKERYAMLTLRDVLVANFHYPATRLSKQFVFDCFMPQNGQCNAHNPKNTSGFPSDYLKGELLQKTTYGEVYHGQEYLISRNLETNCNHLVSALDVVIKVVRCQARGNSTKTLKTEFRQQRNENVLREIEAMDYLHQMRVDEVMNSSMSSTTSSSTSSAVHPLHQSPFMTCRNVLKDYNNLYVFTDYFEFGCLFDYLQVHRCFNRSPEKECKLIIKEIATALMFMHKYGMAHQDLSTENILLHLKPREQRSESDLSSCLDIDKILFETFSFKLIDFGQVVGHQFDDREGGFKDLPGRAYCVGKTIYHCPELFLNNRNHYPAATGNYSDDEFFASAVSHDYNGLRVDSWQLGILMYVLLTGQPPWNYHSPDEFRLKIDWLKSIKDNNLNFHEVWWSFDKHNGETRPLTNCISREAFDLLSRLLQFKPSDRFTMEEVLDHPWLRG